MEKFSDFLFEQNQINNLTLILENIYNDCPEILIGNGNKKTLELALQKLLDTESNWHKDKKAPKCIISIMKELNPKIAKEINDCEDNCEDKCDNDVNISDEELEKKYKKQVISIKKKASIKAIDHTYLTINKVLKELNNKIDKNSRVNAVNFSKRLAQLLIKKHKIELRKIEI